MFSIDLCDLVAKLTVMVIWLRDKNTIGHFLQILFFQ